MQVSKKTCGILKWFESPHLHAAILFNCALYALMFTCINVKAVYAAKASLLKIFSTFLDSFLFLNACRCPE